MCTADWASRGQRIPNPRARHCESPRAKCHSSCSWNKQFQSASRSQVLPTTSGRQQYAVLRKVGRTQTVLTFVDHGRQLEDDSLTNWEPVQISKNRSDMIVFPCVRDKSSSRILDMLQLVQQAFIDALIQGVAVVQSTHNECIHQCFPGIWRQQPPDRTYLAQLKETGSTESRDMICHLELVVKNHAQVGHRCGERYRVQLQFNLIDVDLWQLLARSDPKSAGFCRSSFWICLTASNRRSPWCTLRTAELRPVIRRLVHWDAPAYHQRTSVPPAPFCWWLRTVRQYTAGKGEGRAPNPAERRNPVNRWMTTDPYTAPAGCGPQGTSWSIQGCHHQHRIWPLGRTNV